MPRFSRCLLLLSLALAACQPSIRKSARDEIINSAHHFGVEAPVTREELGQLNSAFADRYVIRLANACDQIKSLSTDPVQRQRAHELKTSSALSVWDIVTNADPYTQLLDLTVAVTLQSIVMINEDLAETEFGPEQGKLIIDATRRARVEIWEIAARALTPAQLENLDYMIWDFRRHNPRLKGVIFVRFNEFAGERGKALVEENEANGLFAPIDEARRSVDEARVLAERAFYYAKRAPLLYAWRVEATVDNILVKPEVRNVLKSIDNAAKSADRAALAVDKLPADIAAERKAILAAFDERQGSLAALMKDARATIGQGDTLMKSGKDMLVELQHAAAAVQDLVKESDTAAGHFMPKITTQPAGYATGNANLPIGNSVTPATAASSSSTSPAAPDAHPFDIRDYTKALVELATAAKELNTVVVSSRDLLGSDAWQKRIAEINESADDRVKLAADQSHKLIDSIFHRVYLSIGIFCFALIVTVIFYRRLGAKKEKTS